MSTPNPTPEVQKCLSFHAANEIDTLLRLLESPSHIMITLEAELKSLEGALNDMSHLIELVDLDKRRRDDMYKEYREMLLLRRAIKNQLYRVEPFAELTKKLGDKGVISEVRRVHGKVHQVSKPSNRVYTCRVKVEYQKLFDDQAKKDKET